MEPTQSSTLRLSQPTLPMDTLTSPIMTVTLIFATIVGVVLLLKRPKDSIPYFNPPGFWGPDKTKKEFLVHGFDILRAAKKRFPGQPFRLMSDHGEVLVLPEQMGHLIRNEQRLSFAKTFQKDAHTHIPGFGPMDLFAHKGELLQDLARKPLTKLLDWKKKFNTGFEPGFDCTHVVTGVSWRSTLSKRRVAKDNKGICYGYVRGCPRTAVPSALRYLVALTSPKLQVMRRKMQRVQELIQPVIDERRSLQKKARKAGDPVPVYNDAIDWAKAECKGFQYNPAWLQLCLSAVAIHTTSDLLSKTMVRLAAEPALLEPLRDETVGTLQTHGWNKAALYNLKLVDSTLKEVQRLAPTEWCRLSKFSELHFIRPRPTHSFAVSMRRIATDDIHLKEQNLTIRKGQYVVVDNTNGLDANIYENPDKFDIYRWMRLRETPEFANKAQLVSTSSLHLGFGHGSHACPGRFFAANETKVALCHLLLKFDWKLAPGTTADNVTWESMVSINPKSVLLNKARKAEIDLDTLSFQTE